MKNILIPTDFSTNSWNAIEYVLNLFDKVYCNFYLLHVADLREAPVEASSFTLLTKENIMPTKEQLVNSLQRLEDSNHNERHHFFQLLAYGNLVDAIRRKVDENQIDLITMGTRGASGLKKLIIGSNTGDVITKVQCNTLIIPENTPHKYPKEIVFPTDYAVFYSHAILTAISEILYLNKAHLKVMYVTKNKDQLYKFQRGNKSYLQDYLEEIFPNSHSFTTISNNNVVNTIQHFVDHQNLDMVIMVAKNLNFLQQLLFDTTIEKLSFHSSTPFLVLHE